MWRLSPCFSFIGCFEIIINKFIPTQIKMMFLRISNLVFEKIIQPVRPLLNTTNTWLVNMDQSVIFFDLKKAFDTVFYWAK
jgi:hypothetical protein